MRALTADALRALKFCSRLAISKAGTAANFARVTRISEGRISTCCSSADDHMEHFLPLDVALEADMESGQPVIVEQMARLLGYRLVKAEASPAANGLPEFRELLDVGRDFNAWLNEYAEALADGRVDEGERRLVGGKLERAIGAMRDVSARGGVGR